jgi:uncharacterized protein (TIGR02118 family)
MIRLTFMMRRRPNETRAEFQRYWLEQHGPLMASFATDLNVLRYVQCHTTEDDHSKLWGRRGEMEAPYDGVAEVWWESVAALNKTLGSAAGRAAGAALVADELNFVDLATSPLWLNYEYPQVNSTPEDLVASDRSSLVKLYFPLRHLSSLTFDEAQAYWRTHHGPIIRRQAAGSGVKRYIQVHRAEHELSELMGRARSTEVEPYTGHAELWIDRNEMGLVTPERRTSSRRAHADESTFIDFERSTMFLCKEHVLIDKR